jgi:signal transduction histidine kinase
MRTQNLPANRDLALLFIVNASLFLSGLALFGYIAQVAMYGQKGEGVGAQVLLAVCVFFGLIRYAIVRGSRDLAAASMVGVYLIAAVWLAYSSGFDVQQSILLFALVIFLSTVLFSSRVGLFISIATVTGYVTLAFVEQGNIIHPRTDWRIIGPTYADIIVYGATFAVLIVIAWLYKREIENSFAEAEQARIALTKERDTLEERVEERADQLKRAEFERMLVISRFADIGRHTSGLFHDLVGPLTTLSLRVEQLYEGSKDGKTKEFKQINRSATEALEATMRVQRFVESVRVQIRNNEVQTAFSLRKEITHVIEALAYPARLNKVEFDVEASDMTAFGNPIKFYRIVQNLVSNAIESYEGVKESGKRPVRITLERSAEWVTLKVSDSGVGIPEEDLGHIFEPLYTTKGIEQGTGIGLTIVQDIVQQDFNGEIEVSSSKPGGTTFTVRIPSTVLVEKDDVRA